MDDANPASLPGRHEESNCTIQQAIRAFQLGIEREKNFQLLVERYYGPVLRFLSRWTPCEQDRQDIAQEVFLKVYKSLAGYRGEAQFGTWVFQITHNTCVRWLGKASLIRSCEPSKLLPMDELNELALDASADRLIADQLEEIIAQEESERLRKGIASLPRQMRRCLELHIYKELRCREIAAALRLSIGTVKAHLSRARERLRDRLDGMPR